MPSVNAALGISQLEKISFIKKEKLKISLIIKKTFRTISYLNLCMTIMIVVVIIG